MELENSSHNLPSKTDTADVVAFVDGIYKDWVVHGVSVKECFLTAVNTEEFLRLFHDRAAVQAALHVPYIIEALSKKAEEGDVEAAKLVLDVAGMVDKGKNVQNAIQINISAEEQAQLERDFIDGRIRVDTTEE